MYVIVVGSLGLRGDYDDDAVVVWVRESQRERDRGEH